MRSSGRYQLRSQAYRPSGVRLISKSRFEFSAAFVSPSDDSSVVDCSVWLSVALLCGAVGPITSATNRPTFQPRYETGGSVAFLKAAIPDLIEPALSIRRGQSAGDR